MSYSYGDSYNRLHYGHYLYFGIFGLLLCDSFNYMSLKENSYCVYEILSDLIKVET